MKRIKKKCSRLLAMLIALSMGVGLLQTNVVAAEIEEAGSQSQHVLQENSDISIEGSDSVGTLLSDAFSKAEDKTSQMEEQGAYISDLVISGNQAVVTYYTEEDADVVVAIYDEETKQMLASGKASVSKGEETQTVTVTIEGDIPQYFNASAFMMDAQSHGPLCEAYSTNLYNRAMQELENSTVADYNPEQVLNLDENEATNFVVYGEGTKIIDYSTDINQVTDNGNGTYTITNADSDFTSLQEGDIFSYSNEDGSVLIAKVKSIAIDGTTVTVTEDADIELDNVFDYVKVEGGVKNPTEQEAELHTESRAATLEGSASVTASVDKKIEGGNPLDGSKKGSFSIKGSLKIDGYVKAYISLKSQYIEAKVSISLSGEVELKGSIKAKEVELMPTAPYLAICPGVFMQIKPVFVIEFAASLKTSVTISAAAGMKYDSESGAKNTSERPALKGEFKAEGTIFIGFKPVAEVFIISDKVGGASVSAEAGLKLALSYTKEASTGATSKHQCKNCLSGKLSAEFKIDAEIEVVDKVVFKANIVKLSFPNILECYYSKDYNEFAWKACPHKIYKITAKVKDEKGKAIDGVTVSGQGVDLNAVTNASGTATFFLPDGTYNLVFTKGKKNATLQLVVEGKAKEVTVTMKNSDAKIIASGKNKYNQFWKLDEKGLLVVSMEGEEADSNDEKWRAYKSRMKIVIIEDGITSIGDGAFAGCGSLASITLPTGLTSIGAGAFEWCSNLISITLPMGLTSIGNCAFRECRSLASITLPTGLASIGVGAFEGCSSLTSITLPMGLTSIIDETFRGCSSLTSITLPMGLTSVGWRAFEGCSSLTSITFPTGLTSIGEYAFDGCESLASIMLPTGLTSIGNGAFYGCESLTSIIFPTGLTSIGNGAFYGCKNLISIIIPISVTRIETYAFSGCGKLSDVYYEGSETDSIGIYIDDYGNGNYFLLSATKHFNYKYPSENKNISSMDLYSVSGSLDDSSIGFSGTIYLKDGMKASNDEWAFIVNGITWSISDTSIVDHITCQWPESLDETSSLSLVMGVTPKKAGTATIIGTLPDGTQVTCTITVNATVAAVVADTVDAVNAMDAADTINAAVATVTDDAVSAVGVVDVIEEVDIADAPNQPNISQNVLASAYTGTINASDTQKTANFTGLVSDNLYVILAVKQPEAEDLLAADNLLYISQGHADASGNLALSYIPRTDEDATVLAYGYNREIKNPPDDNDKDDNNKDLLPNSITASNITKNANAQKAQTVSIKAKAKGGTLKYKSNNAKIKVDNAGKVTISKNYAGKATITITASGGGYATVTKKITVTVKQLVNKITASDITKIYSPKAQTFSIKAKRKGKGKLTYRSNNKNITVSSSGKVKIKAKYIGKAVITIKAAASGAYKAASKKITIKVNPAKIGSYRLVSNGKKVTLSWKRNSTVTGYEIQYSTSKNFKKSTTQTKTVKKNAVTKISISKLKAKKQYYFRIRTYKTVSGKKYYSDWSRIKLVKIRK